MSNKNSFSDIFTTVFRSLLSEELNTCLPGVITEVTDFKKKKVTVQPQIKKKFLDGDELTIEPITNVPLQFFSTSNVIIKPPKSELVGSDVTLFFSQRSLDNWILSDGVVSPGSNTLFSQNDCIAILGLSRLKEDHELIEENNNFDIMYGDKKISLKENDDIEITGGNTITIKANGDIELGSTSLKALVTDELITKLYSLTIPVAGALAGPYAPGSLVGTTTTKVSGQ